jgi:hypothetical protein
MPFTTPAVITAGVVSALAGVAGAAIALPSSPAAAPSLAVAAPSATPEVRTETVRRTVHVTRRDRRAGDGTPSRHSSAPAATPTAVSRRHDDSGHHSGFDDSGHPGGDDDSGHHSGGDDD